VEHLMNILNVLFAGVIAFAAWQTWRIYKAMLGTTKQIERGWISLERLALEELERFDDPEYEGPVQPIVVIRLKNSGRTPVRVTRAKAILFMEPRPLPDDPPYELREWADAPNGPPPAVLVANEETNWRYVFGGQTFMGNDYRQRICARGLAYHMWIFGRIEYTDDFGKPHRYGFVRAYDPSLADTIPPHPPGERWAHVHSPKYSYAD
jgi:hypothetical protein